MIDLHCHLLPGIDDGAIDLDASLAMARAFVDQGVTHVACTPHILPGRYNNTGPEIREAIAALQQHLQQADIPLSLLTGADNHIDGAFVDKLKSGHLLSLADSRYVLVEPPHHIAPARLDSLFFDLLLAQYVPILTHPERLTWIEDKYDLMCTLQDRGVWMQITSGSLRGRFGRRAQYWSERMLDEGRVHLLATDAHDPVKRKPDLLKGKLHAERRVGAQEAEHLVVTRPLCIVSNNVPSSVPAPSGKAVGDVGSSATATTDRIRARHHGGASFAQRVRRLFG